jgi:hypothetical protein
MPEPEEVISQYRAGELTAEAAAELLLPALKAAGKLTLDITEEEMPVLEALQRLAAPQPEPLKLLTWESRAWLALGGLADDFWQKLCDRGLDRVPQCLNYVFLVGSHAAATALRQWIETRSDHVVTATLPEAFEESHGRVFGRTPPRVLTHAHLVEWAGWLQSIPPVPDASLDGLGVSGPPAAGGPPT